MATFPVDYASVWKGWIEGVHHGHFFWSQSKPGIYTAPPPATPWPEGSLFPELRGKVPVLIRGTEASTYPQWVIGIKEEG